MFSQSQQAYEQQAIHGAKANSRKTTETISSGDNMKRNGLRAQAPIRETPRQATGERSNMQQAPNIYDMNREEFRALLAVSTTAQDVLDNANSIYGFMSTLFEQNAQDSVLREWAFQWASEILEIDYQVIYDQWLGVTA